MNQNGGPREEGGGGGGAEEGGGEGEECENSLQPLERRVAGRSGGDGRESTPDTATSGVTVSSGDLNAQNFFSETVAAS